MSELVSWQGVLVIVSAFVVSTAVTTLRLRFGDKGLDRPGHRSLHVHPTPHGGGLGIMAAALLGGLWAGVAWPWLVALAGLASLSWLDDNLDLPFWLRLLFHLGVSAGLVLVCAPVWAPSLLLAIAAIVWASNAFNFMDGLDGLAASMASVGFAAFAVGLAHAGEGALALLCLAVSSAALAFLRFNLAPARIFMGDCGAIPLGFLAGGLGWYAWQLGGWPLWFPLMVFAPFLLDTSVTLLLRLWRREKIWQAHCKHYYQRMARSGVSHASVCAGWQATILAGAVLAVVVLLLSPAVFSESFGWGVAVLWGAVLVFMGHRIDVKCADAQKR